MQQEKEDWAGVTEESQWKEKQRLRPLCLQHHLWRQWTVNYHRTLSQHQKQWAQQQEEEKWAGMTQVVQWRKERWRWRRRKK